MDSMSKSNKIGKTEPIGPYRQKTEKKMTSPIFGRFFSNKAFNASKMILRRKKPPKSRIIAAGELNSKKKLPKFALKAILTDPKNVYVPMAP